MFDLKGIYCKKEIGNEQLQKTTKNQKLLTGILISIIKPIVTIKVQFEIRG